MTGYNKKNQGLEVENYVMKKFREHNITVTRIDDYYDLKLIHIGKLIRLEVKSCNFIINKSKNRIDYGRFDFTNSKNRSLQRTKGIIICFVVVIGNCYEILGFMNSRSAKAKRYIPLKDMMNRKVTRFDKFVERICK